MNSTENDAFAAQLGTLFDDVVLPLSQRLQAEGKQVFPLAPDVSWLSYYVRRRHSSMTAGDFTNASCADRSEMEQRLRTHSEQLGRTELAGLAHRFAAAAQVLPAQRVAQAGRSPYI